MSKVGKSSTILKISQLEKIYDTAQGPLQVLQPLDLEIVSGASIAIVGPSGSGKTTLLGIMAGLDVPSAGSIEIAGTSLGELTEDERALFRNKHLGFVFQNFQLLPTLTALENVMAPLELRGEHGVEAQAKELLAKVGLQDRLSHYPVQLSGGEQQRVALARAFINRPQILFADEPTGNLDETTSENIIEQLFALNREAGTTLVLVTHDMELAGRLDRTVRMRSGQLEEL